MTDIFDVRRITPSLEADELEALINYLRQVQPVDLTAYKRPSLMRRIKVRMQCVGAERYQDYLDRLKQQPDEVVQLLNTVFTNFTSFFRDPLVWDYLENQVIPQIITRTAHEPIRIWSAGCASGEEVYSLAMLLAEALGPEQFQQRVRIYGTDIDRDAIRQARRGYYSSAAVEAIPPALLERYFEPTTDGYCWKSELRYPISFYTHNLIQSPALSQIDLLVCRNTLMYFIPEAQLRTLVRFHLSLKQDGCLLLGQAENLITRPQTWLFTPTNRQAKTFTRVPDAHPHSHLLPIASASFAASRR